MGFFVPECTWEKPRERYTIPWAYEEARVDTDSEPTLLSLQPVCRAEPESHMQNRSEANG